jgi:hypothetical protein
MSGAGHLPYFAHLELLTAWCRPESDPAPWGGISISSTNSGGSTDRVGRGAVPNRHFLQAIAREIEIAVLGPLQAHSLHGAQLGLEGQLRAARKAEADALEAVIRELVERLNATREGSATAR